jgi:hypothetical protein
VTNHGFDGGTASDLLLDLTVCAGLAGEIDAQRPGHVVATAAFVDLGPLDLDTSERLGFCHEQFEQCTAPRGRTSAIVGSSRRHGSRLGFSHEGDRIRHAGGRADRRRETACPVASQQSPKAHAGNGRLRTAESPLGSPA